MTAGEDVAFEPALNSVFAENFHHTATECEIATILIFVKVVPKPNFLSNVVNRVEFVGLGFIGSEESELVLVVLDNFAKEGSKVGHAATLGASRFVLDVKGKVSEIGKL